MFGLISRLNTLSICHHRCASVPILSISSSSSNRKETLEQKLGIRPKPKRPMTAFFRYTQEVARPTLLKENPSMPVTEVTKVAAIQWKQVDQELKKKLQTEFQKDMEQYRLAMEDYKEELSKVDKETLKKFNMDSRSKKEKSEIMKQRAALGCPKKPVSSFFLYLQKRKSDMPQASHKDVIATASEEWKNLDPAEKSQYMDMQATNKINYAREMALWERDMRESGNAHLLSPNKSDKRPKSQ